MAIDPKRVQTLFLQIVELPPEKREAALDHECKSDVELRRRVEALISAHDDPDSLLLKSPESLHPTLSTDASDQANFESDAADQTIEATRVGELAAGTLIGGRYSLEEKLGEGGMGEVWVARQSEPVKRRVALKLIKSGMDSQAVVGRFEQERQALAMMDHPNIARVLDGGLTPTRQPYFVMELVNGLALNKFCDELKLTPRQRLELFVPICQAIQHAHQKGIVHRDLKPANILVTMIDGKPVPKVIDFGVAKATSGKLTDESMATHFGAVVGTLEYMAPEQAGFSGTDVDTRADIYSLGVILYELLTGLRPIDANRLNKAALTEMIRIIREEDPSKPSTRLSTDEALPSLASLRQTEPRKLMALLKGELDWVVMKCLEKERDRRYETASSLARDIERHLQNEPVEARAPSHAYRLRKFARRNRTSLVAITAVAASLVIGLVFSVWQAVRATHAEALANERFESEQRARQEADTARNGEEKQRLRATAASELAKRREYAATMLLAQKHWEQNHLNQFHDLLKAVTPKHPRDDLRGFEWYYWLNAARAGFEKLDIHEGTVNCVDFNGDGTQFATGAGESSTSGQLRIWDSATRQIIREFPKLKYRVNKVAFSPDNKLLASACGRHTRGGKVQVWDLSAGEEIFKQDFKNSVHSVDFSPDGSKLAAGSTVFGKWGEIRVWDWKTKEVIFSQEHENKGYRGLIFMPDGNRIATGARENGVPNSAIEIWDLKTKEVEIRPANADFVFSLSVRKSDHQMAAAVGSWNGPPGVVKQWDKDGNALTTQLIGHQGRVVSVCFNHAGDRLATGSYDHSIKIWDAESGAEVSTLRGHRSSILDVCFSPDDSIIASGSADRESRFWKANTIQAATVSKTQRNSIHGLAFSKDGKRIATAGHDGNAKIWDAESGLEILSLHHQVHEGDEPKDRVNAVAFSPDGKRLATACGNSTSFGFGDPPGPGTITVWDIATQEPTHRLVGHSTGGSDVHFSPDGKWLASASGGWNEPGEVKVWNLETGKELDLGMQGTGGRTKCLAFSPDGRLLAWSRFDYPADVKDQVTATAAREEGRTRSIVVVWDLHERKRKCELLHKGHVFDLAFRHDGRQLATGCADETAMIWDLATENCIQVLRGHTARVHSIAYSPDGNRLVTCGNDQTVILWDLATGRGVFTYTGHGHFVWAVAFSPQGDKIASAGQDGRLHIWNGKMTHSTDD